MTETRYFIGDPPTELLYFSESRKEYRAIESMHHNYLVNAIRKMESDEENLDEYDRAVLAAMKEELATRPTEPPVDPAPDREEF